MKCAMVPVNFTYNTNWFGINEIKCIFFFLSHFLDLQSNLKKPSQAKQGVFS